MALPIRLDPEARAELVAAVAWYDEQRLGLGRELLATVHEALSVDDSAEPGSRVARRKATEVQATSCS